MPNVILYSTGCPKCNILKTKLKAKGIEYTENNDVDEMVKMGFMSAPILSVDGVTYTFADANEWIKNQQEDRL